jgi:acyl-ACP thioesterase
MPGEGFYTLRVFEIDGLSEDDTVSVPLVRAKTSWVLIDLAAGRPVRATRRLPEIFASDAAPIDPGFREIPRLSKRSSLMKETFFPVRFHDLDTNIHVNNAVYFEWVYEATPIDPMAYGIHSISAEFRVSAKWGDVLRVEVRELESSGPLREFVCTMWSTAVSGEEDVEKGKKRKGGEQKPLARFWCAWEALQST